MSLLQGSTVDQFRDAVKAKFADSLLSGIASSVLLVYERRSAFDGRGAYGGGQQPLRASQAVEGLGARENDALVVVVPPRGQYACDIPFYNNVAKSKL